MDDVTQSPTPKDGQKGFTLIETATALLVMMIGGLGICAVFAFAIKNNTGSRDRAAALAVAQQQMEIYRNMEFSNAGLNATVAPTVVTANSADRTYTVRTTICNGWTAANPCPADTTAGSLRTVKIDVTPQLSDSAWANSTVQVSIHRSTFALGAYSGGL
jgi:Tfp pilus assembly protein PilV